MSRLHRLLLCLLLMPALALADALEVIPLQHRSAEDLLPLLRPLVRPPTTLGGQGDKLIVRGSPAEIEQLRQLLGALDVAPRRLLVSVRQGSADDLLNRGGGSDAAAGFGSDGVQAGGRVSVDHYGTRRNDDTTQGVQVLDGQEAFIRAGAEVPVSSSGTVIYGRGIVAQDVQTEYRDASTGFYVRPRLSGSSVTVEVRPSSSRALPDGSFATSGLSTTVSGPLGTWLPLGGSVESRQQERNADTYSTREHSRAERIWLLRVEELP